MTKDQVTQGMACWAQDDDANITRYTRWQAQIVAPFLGQRVLEIGPSGGRFSTLFNSSRTFERYVAVEPSVPLFQSFRKNCPQIESYHCFAEDLDASFDGQFDTVFLSHVLEHIEKDVEFLKAIRRFLSKKGKIVIMVPALSFLMSELDRNIGHFRRYDKKMIRAAAQSAGYDIHQLRYDNLIGILGWFWFCTIRKIHYQEKSKKKVLMGAFNFFDKAVLPIAAALEKHFPPPIGLNLTAILEKRD